MKAVVLMKVTWGSHEGWSSSWWLPGAIMKASGLHEGYVGPT